MTKARKQDIALAYVVVTRGRIPTQLDNVLTAMRAMIGDVSESDVREAIRWALRPSSLPFPRAKPPRQGSKRLRPPQMPHRSIRKPLAPARLIARVARTLLPIR